MQRNSYYQILASATSGWRKLDGATLFYRLRAANGCVWKVGRKYYLCFGHHIVDVNNYNDLWRALGTGRLMGDDEIVPGKALRDLQQICKRCSIRLEEQLLKNPTSEDFQAYWKVRRDLPQRKAFFNIWVQTHPQP